MHDSRCSERALREIYAKAFEIVVKTAAPQNIMASYNKINGVYSHYNYDLFTSMLRGEWGYDGAVMTDWWMKPGESPDNHNIYDNAYRVQAQVDVLMPGMAVVYLTTSSRVECPFFRRWDLYGMIWEPTADPMRIIRNNWLI